MGIAAVVQQVLGPDIPLAIDAYDGSRGQSPRPHRHADHRRPDAIRRFLTAPGELGLGRAYVAGDIDFEGDLFGALTALRRAPAQARRPKALVELAKDASDRAA